MVDLFLTNAANAPWKPCQDDRFYITRSMVYHYFKVETLKAGSHCNLHRVQAA
jgi:hypothetical protein